MTAIPSQQSRRFTLTPFGEFALLEGWYDGVAQDLKSMQPGQEAFLIGTRDGEFRVQRIKDRLTTALGTIKDLYEFRIMPPNASRKFHDLYVERKAP